MCVFGEWGGGGLIKPSRIMLGQTGAFKYIPKIPDQMELTNKKVPALKGQILNQSSTRNAPSTKFPH